MYPHIEKVKFIKLPVEQKTFVKIIRHRLFELNLEKTSVWETTLSEDNSFIRIVHENWYADIKIRKIISEDHFTILLGEIMDYEMKKYKKGEKTWSDKQKEIYLKNKPNNH